MRFPIGLAKKGWKGLRAARRTVSFYMRLYSARSTPIIVYQMGKVGSSAVRESLKNQGFSSVFHAHLMNPTHIQRVRQEYLAHSARAPNEWKGRMLYNSIVRGGKRAKFISLVREPLGRNISAFFQNFKRFTGTEYDQASFMIDELADIFIKGYEHTVPLTWFDWEVKPVLGIDVYQHPFPQDKGWLTIKKGSFELLILKLEIDDSRKERALADFLGVSEFRLVRANVAREKKYAKTYQDFLRSIKLPESYVEIMCNSEYIRHFYSEAEIEAIRARWRDRTETVELPADIRQELSKASRRITV